MHSLDDAPAHQATSIISKDGGIKAMHLPPRITALCQPMDQSVLESLKWRYCKALLQRLLLEYQEGRLMIEFVKSINSVFMTAIAWDDLPSSTLTRSWNKLLPTVDSTHEQSSSDDSNPAVDCEDLACQLDSGLQEEDIREWIDGDSDDQ